MQINSRVSDGRALRSSGWVRENARELDIEASWDAAII
jgi:hypothetical protein